FVRVNVLLSIRMREVVVAVNNRRPRSAAWILIEWLAAGASQRDDALEPVLPDALQVLRESRVTVDAVVRPPHRPIEDEAGDRVRMRYRKRHRGRAAHARAEYVRRRDSQVSEQPFALRHVTFPGDRLDATARLAALASIEHDAG